MPNHSQDSYIFISYACSDGRELARKLYESIKVEGYATFLDEESIVAGQRWKSRLEKEVMVATHLIAIVTPGSMESRYCEKEWNLAETHNVRIIPLIAKPGSEPLPI